MKRVVSEEEATRRLPELLEAACRGDDVVIERDGAELAAIVSPRAHEALERQREEATRELRTIIDEIRETNRGVDPDVIQAEVDEAVREVRRASRSR